MPDDPRSELEMTQALLRQARADRDRLQLRVLDLERKINVLKRVPLFPVAKRLRSIVRTPTARPRAIAPKARSGTPRPGRYMDVSVLRNAHRTGIARVVIRLAAESGFDLVTLTDGRLVHDVTFYEEIFGVPAPRHLQRLNGQPLVGGPGVTVVNAAIALDSEFRNWQWELRSLRVAGGNYVQIVHDLLPITMPDFFDLGMRRRFPEWLAFVAEFADLIVTDSAATRDDLKAWLEESDELPPAARENEAIVVCPLGCDSLAVGPRHERAEGVGPRLLVVGTVEPRKAVDVVVAAARRLRSGGLPVSLTVVGARGWADHRLLAELDALAKEPWFRWEENATDADLIRAYATSDLLVAASRGEGFGLPIAEAMVCGIPAVARDLPVFRELLGDAGTYFAHDVDLAAAIETALATPPSPPRPVPTWQQAAARLGDLLGALDDERAGHPAASYAAAGPMGSGE